jgi:predicted enzyme related to lactoylglutathione lyase
MTPRLNLVAIRSSTIEKAIAVYEAIGLKFERHAHGSGPEHYAADHDGLVFEIYPLLLDQHPTDDTRIGFKVDSVDQTLADALAAGATLITPAKQSTWGYRAVVADVDGHRIELTEKRDASS